MVYLRPGAGGYTALERLIRDPTRWVFAHGLSGFHVMSDWPTAMERLTNPFWMVLVIGGPSGVGKSTLGKEIARRAGATWLQIDDIRLALQYHPVLAGNATLRFFMDTPDVWRQPVSRLVEAFVAVADVLAPSLQIIIENHLAIREPVVIEGDGILPSLLDIPVMQHHAQTGMLSSAWIIPQEPGLLLANSTRRGRGISEGAPQDEGQLWAQAGWAFGQWLHHEARQRDLPVLSPEPYATLPERIARIVTGSTGKTGEKQQ